VLRREEDYKHRPLHYTICHYCRSISISLLSYTTVLTMRRKHLAIFVSAPMANALSLGNFQGITSNSIPLSCQLAYAATIPSCTVRDFGGSGCTAACVSGLESVANNVQSACDEVEVSSKTLLGTILDGGIIQALCPALAVTTQQPQATELPVNSVTIPTDSRGVTGGLGLKTTTTTQQPQTTQQHTTQQPPKPSTITVTTTSRTNSASNSETTTSTISDDTFLTTIFPTTTTQPVNGGGAVPVTTSSTTSSTTKAASTPKADKGSGGGSPFDISSNGGTNRLRGSFLGAVIAIVACTLLVR